ncbi:hypothetical protein KC19_10G177900, partial [Ceratodon purpureus]
ATSTTRTPPPESPPKPPKAPPTPKCPSPPTQPPHSSPNCHLLGQLAMGISLVVGLPSAAVLAAFVALRQSNAPPYITLPVLHSSIVGFTAAIAAHPRINYTGLFRKSREGAFPWWSYAAFYPYLLTLRAYVHARRFLSQEPVFTEVEPGLFVGGWPALQRDVPPGLRGVVDCTCELPRNSCVNELPYLCVPIWDTRGPQPVEIENAVQWALKQRGESGHPVLVHCAFGHGRSVTIMCALLITLGVCDTWQNAETYIKRSRPRARLNKGQKESLKEWQSVFASKQEKKL